MALMTTTIGTYPKPDYTPVPGWVTRGEAHRTDPTQSYSAFLRDRPPDSGERLDRATREVVADQVEIGIDVPTDGEVRREHYVFYHLRHLDGFDFDRLTVKVMRDGGWQASVPTVVGPLKARASFLASDWRVAQLASPRPVKMTLPGPLTIMDSTADAHYRDERALAAALGDVLNVEIRRLAEAGCRWIQVDEPVFARKPAAALAYGLEALERCFHGLPEDVDSVVHVCCGYPSQLNDVDYPKADPLAYFDLAEGLDRSSIGAVSIEDAHCHNDLRLLERFASTRVILGVIGIARSRIEPVEDIRVRLLAALEHIDASRLIAGPDCGLIMLDRDTARAKLANMVAAARSAGSARQHMVG